MRDTRKLYSVFADAGRRGTRAASLELGRSHWSVSLKRFLLEFRIIGSAVGGLILADGARDDRFDLHRAVSYLLTAGRGWSLGGGERGTRQLGKGETRPPPLAAYGEIRQRATPLDACISYAT